MRVALVMPQGGTRITDGAARAFYLWPTNRFGLARLTASCSASCHTFNTLWTEALNLRHLDIRYFAMIHDDIEAEEHWLDKLIDEKERVGADVIAAVSPIKSIEGVTSTALDQGDLWRVRRLAMHEVMDLPETFGTDDVGHPLLVNNGLWVCDFTSPWVEKFSFEILNRTAAMDNGNHRAQMVPEDWLCSRKFHELGLKVFATRKVKLSHDGHPNHQAWGTWKTDEAYQPMKVEEMQCV